jgi:PAS domain-containing protein
MPTTTTPVAKARPLTALAAATKMCQNLYNQSQQAMYLYQDDHNKSCNARFAKLLGYANPEAWAAVHESFPQAFVQPESQDKLIDAYQNAIQNGVGGTIPVTWKRRDGKPVETEVTMVPIDVEGRRLALHFISEA